MAGMSGDPTSTPVRAARPDASMSLLVDLMEHPLDEGYAEAAARRRSAEGSAGGGVRPTSRRDRRVHLLFAGFLVLVGALLATALVQARTAAPATARAREALVERIERGSAEVDRLERMIATLRREVETAQAAGLAATGAGARTAESLAALSAVTGAAAAVGPGVVVTVDDAPEGAVGAGAEPGSPEEDLARVLDRDLQILVNALWAAGAEGVSINGQRLSTLTAIRSAGEAILVDFRPLRPPYEIRAIGDPRTLEATFADDPSVREFRTVATGYGIRFETSRQDEVRLPAAGSLRLSYARTAS